MLNFIGRGSAFNTKEGNNSAFVKRKNHLLLIDCGSDVFSKIQALGLLEGVKEIDVILTHMHPDHFGSLGDLIFYSYFAMGEKGSPSLTLHHSSNKVEETLENMGVYSYMYFSLSMRLKEKRKIIFEDITYEILPTYAPHYPSINDENPFVTIGFFLTNENETIFYSGDTYSFNAEALKMLYLGEISKYYQDVSWKDFKGNPHMSYSILKQSIPDLFKNKIYCMHIDEEFNEKIALNDGFKVVETYKKNNSAKTN